MVVKRTKRIASINVGEGMLGRVIDPLGVPLDLYKRQELEQRNQTCHEAFA